jgi:hypothetical protein
MTMPKFKGTGGPVQPGEIYVERVADDRVRRLVDRLEYVHLIAPRQMGKTSLLHRLCHQLRERGWRCAYVDLSTVQVHNDQAWYNDLGRQVGDQLTPQNLPQFSDPIDFKLYLVNVLLSDNVIIPTVLLLDEIGGLSRLPSREQFLMTMRTMYRKPLDFPILESLTFVLAGAADPDAMVQDPNISPFNVGERITLDDFNPTQTRQITQHLQDEDLFGKNGAPAQVLERIYKWTQGHPYLTQKLCALLEQKFVDHALKCLTPQDVDNAAQEYFLKPPDSLDLDSNIKHILKGLQDKERRNLFERIRTRETISEQDRSLHCLYLLGAIKRKNGQIVIRNPIYEEATIVPPEKPVTPSTSPPSLVSGKISSELFWGFPKRLGKLARNVGSRWDDLLNWIIGILIIVLIILFILGNNKILDFLLTLVGGS